ncbi:MAG: acyl-CoA thioesterase [Verrucomicrobiota bacterium]
MTHSNAQARYRHVFAITDKLLDQNGHVNNVVYVQWMQDVAILHYDSIGGSEIDQSEDATWFARSHKIDYLKPALEGDHVEALTWVASFHRVQCLRMYQFTRKSDGALLAKGETNWVFVDAKSGRPKRIPEKTITLLQTVGKPEPSENSI